MHLVNKFTLYRLFLTFISCVIDRSDVEEGGETIFPAATGNFSSVPGWNELSECGKRGPAVKPKMGDALVFWSMRPDATLDPSSLHGRYFQSSNQLTKKMMSNSDFAVRLFLKCMIWFSLILMCIYISDTSD